MDGETLESKCEEFPKEVQKIKKITEIEAIPPLIREIYGFWYFNKDSFEIPDESVKVRCQNDEISCST